MKPTLILFLMIVFAWAPLRAADNLDYGKSHRIGLRGGLYYPSMKSEAFGIDLVSEWNAKIHQNVDSGPKIGLFYRTIKDGAEHSTFLIVPLSFTFRFYPFSRTADSTHGWLAPYATVNGSYFFSLLLESNTFNDTTKIIPEGLGGFGASAGLGVEFGSLGLVSIPDFVFFAEVQYRKASMTSRRDYGLNLDGIAVSVGGRF